MPTNLKRLILISISILLRCLGRETPLHAKISDPNTEVRAIKMPKKSTIDFQNIYCTVTFASKPPLKNMNQLFAPHKSNPNCNFILWIESVERSCPLLYE